MKEKYGSTVPLSRKANIKTRREVANQREYWRKKKQDSRSRLHAQKKRRIKEYDRKRKMESKKVLNGDLTPTITDENESVRIFTPEAERKAFSRAKKYIPKDPKRYAGIVSKLITKASPKKKAALANLYEGVKQNDTIKQIAHRMKQNQKKEGKQFTRKFVGILKDSYVNLRQMSRETGIRYNYLQKVSKLNTEVWITRKDAIEETVLEKVKDFYMRPEASTVLPDISKVIKGKNVYTLEKTLKQTHRDFLEQNQDTHIGFSKFFSLKPPNVKTYSNTPLQQCICEYCANVSLKIKTLKHKIKSFPENKYEAVNKTLCPKPNGALYHKRECIYRDCSSCGVSMLNELVKQICDEKCTLTWYKWDTITRKVGTKITSKKGLKCLTGSGSELIAELKKELTELSIHLFVATWQHRQFSHITSNLQPQMVVMVLDFGQNYTCFYQDEAQSAHWSAEQVTVHPSICYYKCKTCSETVKEDIVMLSGDLKHDFYAVSTFIRKANEHLIQKRGLTIDHHIQFSDGCAGQYKSKNAFEGIADIGSEFECTVERNFFGSRHGKGPSDACTGVVKSAVTRAVKARQALVTCPEEMYKFCTENLTKDCSTDESCIHNLRTFILITDIDRKIEMSAKTVQGTRKVHAVKSGNIPKQILTRQLSCFCASCLNGEEDCENYQYTGTWTQVDLRTGRQRQNPIKNLDEMKPQVSEEKNRPNDKGNKKFENKTSKKRADKNELTCKDTAVEEHANLQNTVVLDSEDYVFGTYTCENRKQYFAALLRDLSTAETFEELKVIADHYSVEMSTIQEPCPLPNISLTDLPVFIDADALQMIPNDIPEGNFMPVVVQGDGNCLPRSAAVLAYGNEEDHQEFRVRIILELVANEDLYLNDDYLSSALELNIKTRQLSKQFAMYSSEYIPGDVLTPAAVRRVFRKEVLDITKINSFMGIWQLFAIASVLNSRVISVYPQLGSPVVRKDLNRLIMPRNINHEDTIKIMWSSTRQDLTMQHWIPNHFVPLLPLLGDIDQIDIVDLNVGQIELKVGEMEPEVGKMKPNVGQIEPDVGQMESEVGQMKPEVGQMESDVGQMESEVGQMKPEVGQMESDVGQMESEVGQMKPEVGQMESEVGQMESEVGQMKQEVGQMESEVGQMKPEVGQMESDVGQMESEVGQMESEVGQMEPEVGQMKPEVGQMESDVGQMESEVGQMKPEVGQMESGVGQMESEVGQMKPEVGQMESDVGQMESDVGQMESDVGQMESEVGQMESEVGQMEAEVGQMESDVGQVELEVGLIESNVGKMELEVGQIEPEVGQMESEVGDMNLIQHFCTDNGTKC
ncbi:uncharacterized protein [Mytilus edulis]|uniref:uncharacterized protein isoform X2 n=1 Tax=Mytilus edulis TaxID=6550 RepID=UPI0039F0884D